jgi:LemA protein
MKHEAQTLTDITRLRATGLPDATSPRATSSIARCVRSASIWRPTRSCGLRTSRPFADELEEQLSAGRRAFNAAVTDYNNSCDMFPTNIVAGLFGFKRRALFEITAAERANPDVKSLFGTP